MRRVFLIFAALFAASFFVLPAAAQENGCTDNPAAAFLAGNYTVIGHAPAGADAKNLYSGAARVAQEDCRLIVRWCDGAGARFKGELKKTEITGDRLPAWTLALGGRSYLFEIKSTAGNYAVFDGTYGIGGGPDTGHEFWYADDGRLPPVCAAK
jgi:hypothetical protein